MEFAGLAQPVGDELEVQMRCPSAIDGVVADRTDLLARLHAHAIMHHGKRLARKVAIERPEDRTAIASLMFQNDRRPIVEGEIVVGHAQHLALERCVERRARCDEDVDAEVLRPPLG